MLFEKKFTSSDTVTMKLSNGEEIISRFVEETENTYLISKPMTISVTNSGLGLIPFLFTADVETDFTLNKNNVLTIVRSEKQFADQYVQATTGIKIV